MYKVGDKVIVVSLKNTEEAGFGLVQDMFYMLNKVHTIRNYNQVKGGYRVGEWVFHPKDLRLVQEIPQEKHLISKKTL